MGPAAVTEAVALAKEGWQCIRFGGQGIYREVEAAAKIESISGTKSNAAESIFEPRESIARTIEWMPKIRASVDAVKRGTAIGVEYHHRLSVAEAAAFCQRLPLGTLDWLEEPIRDESPEAYQVLRSLTATPFALGEEFSSKWQFLPMVNPQQ